MKTAFYGPNNHSRRDLQIILVGGEGVAACLSDWKSVFQRSHPECKIVLVVNDDEFVGVAAFVACQQASQHQLKGIRPIVLKKVLDSLKTDVRIALYRQRRQRVGGCL